MMIKLLQQLRLLRRELVLLSLMVSFGSVSALFAEDAGVLDFLIATTGHGVDTSFVHGGVVPNDKNDGAFVITSDRGNNNNNEQQSSSSSSCTVASRNLRTGVVQWRRNVCASKVNGSQRNGHAVATAVASISNNDDNNTEHPLLVTNDAHASVRAWTANDGALLWDVPPAGPHKTQEQPRVWTVVSGAVERDNDNDQHDDHDLRTLVAATTFADKKNGADDSTNVVLALYDASDGQVLGTIDAHKAAGQKHNCAWLAVLPQYAYTTKDKTRFKVVQALIAHVQGSNNKRHSNEEAVASKVTLVELTLPDKTNNDSYNAIQVASSTKLPVDSAFLVSTLRILPTTTNGDSNSSKNNDWHALALDPKRKQLVHFSPTLFQTTPISMLHPLWTSMVAILPNTSNNDHENNDATMIRIVGRDNRYAPVARDSMALFRFDTTSNVWDQWYAANGDEATQFRGIAHCPTSNLVVAVEYAAASDNKVIVFRPIDANKQQPVVPTTTPKDEPSSDDNRDRRPLSSGGRHKVFSPLIVGNVVGDDVVDISETDAVSGFDIVSCEDKSTSILLTTTRGTTILLTVSRNDATGKAESVVEWTAEEGLAQVSDALLLDASHPASVLDAVSEQEEAEALRRLSFSARLQSQVDDIVSFVSSTRSTSSRDVDFGFVKVAMLLSQSAHRVWGIPTSGSSRGTVAWKVDLPQSAVWHSLVHGTTNSKAEVHGINGGTHSPEVLVLSSFPDSSMEWTCLDGTTGEVHSSALTTASSPVAQVMPLFGGFGMCRQLVVLVHEDKSITVFPGDENGKEAVREHLRANKNGLYSHTVDRETNVLQSFEIVEEDSAFAAKLVGRTDFPGEDIVQVSYPHRDEAVQAPCHILGDDSLLLKYLNPHLAVVVTMSTEADSSSEQSELLSALNSAGSGGKRKPAGATPPGETTPPETNAASEDAPNLFVNVVDTVSGRVLHRASHSNASPKENIPVLISENWVFYAFFNEKIRRTEVGVFTLYEGMIDRNGLTAFHSPEQSLTFSSLEARDAKPVVLTKTYVLAKPVTALGITSTRGGISSRLVIFATGDDRLMTVPRELLEPRRPFGDVKESEKLEGLMKYTPLIPLVSLWSPSYNQTVNADAVISTSTGLESQSLVLAFGGADIFFTRMAPSKGFDLLPESFNKILLSIVVVGLLVALSVVRSMSAKKMVKMAWS